MSVKPSMKEMRFYRRLERRPFDYKTHSLVWEIFAHKKFESFRTAQKTSYLIERLMSR